MARSKCRLCVTISTIWKLGKIHFRHFMEDIRAFNEVQEYSCKIHYSEDMTKVSLIPKIDEIKKVREIAASKYDSTVTDQIFAIPEDVKAQLNNQILKENT
jgi:uncharacterized protein CbrC (UPF0167 family)